MTTPVAVVGAGGYTGQELVELIVGHPALTLAGVFGSRESAGVPMASLAPKLRGVTAQVVQQASPEALIATGAKHVFLATPHELSMTLAPKLVELGITVFDLSGAFRLQNLDLYPKHYGFTHEHPASVESALYTIPELCKKKIAGSKLVSLAGCYATSVILPLTPIVRKGLLAPGRSVVVDSVSGVSGAGRKPSQKTSFCEVSQSPYAVLSHRHEPEMIEHAGTDVIFTPHLGTYDRGIVSTIHIEVASGVTRSDVEEALNDAFGEAPFVRLLPEGEWPSVAGVRHTNMIDIGLALDTDRNHLIVISALDNLLKGASGQAIQALNIHLGLDERVGLMPGGGS